MKQCNCNARMVGGGSRYLLPESRAWLEATLLNCGVEIQHTVAVSHHQILVVAQWEKHTHNFHDMLNLGASFHLWCHCCHSFCRSLRMDKIVTSLNATMFIVYIKQMLEVLDFLSSLVCPLAVSSSNTCSNQDSMWATCSQLSTWNCG